MGVLPLPVRVGRIDGLKAPYVIAEVGTTQQPYLSQVEQIAIYRRAVDASPRNGLVDLGMGAGTLRIPQAL